MLTLRRPPRLAGDQQARMEGAGGAGAGAGGRHQADPKRPKHSTKSRGGGGCWGRAEKAGKIKGGRAGGWEMNAAD